MTTERACIVTKYIATVEINAEEKKAENELKTQPNEESQCNFVYIAHSSTSVGIKTHQIA